MSIGDDFPDVLAAARAGDPGAIERIYRDTAPLVLGYLRGTRAPDAEDLASDVYVSMITSIVRFEGDERAFRSWLLTIAHRRMVDAARRASAQPAESVDPEELAEAVIDITDPESAALSRLRLDGVLAVVDALTEDQRAVLLLRVVADLSINEIASVVAKPETAVKALLRRAFASMERRLGPDGKR